MPLDKEGVARIAALARIRLDEAELAPLAADLSQILQWVERLNELDTGAVAPMTSVAAVPLPLREDRVDDGDCRDAVLANVPLPAKGAADRRFFAVPKVIE